MSSAADLLNKNRAWAQQVEEQEQGFFERLAEGQAPRHLWIGCSDSRVPASQVVGGEPGDLFVHRNVGNVVVHTDFNCLSVLQYAVEALQVENVILCGHYGCGGVKAALQREGFGLVDNWIRHIQDVMQQYEALLEGISDEQERLDALCELNVIEQVANLCRTTIVQEAWERGQDLTVRGWIYGLADGRLRDLGLDVTASTTWDAVCKEAAAAVAEGRGEVPAK